MGFGRKLRPKSATKDGWSSLSDLAAQINTAHHAHSAAAKSSVEHAIVAGRLLLAAKLKVPPRRWRAWMKVNCKFAGRTARLYMKVAKDPPQMAIVAKLTLEGCARKEGRHKRGASKNEGAVRDLDAAWANATMQHKADLIKKNLRLVKSLVKRIESVDAVAGQRGEPQPYV
jgi:hypothetical protein